MDWLRYFHFSLSDLRGLVFWRTVILVVMAVFIYLGVGIFYKVLALQLIRMRPAPAVEIKASATPVAAREPADAYRVISERNLFGTATKTVMDKQTAAAPQQDIALLFEVKGTVAGEGKYGFAIIEEKGTRKQRLVKAGDVVAGAKVIQIKRNAVDVLVEEQMRTLKMAEMKEAPILPVAVMAPTSPSPLPSTFVINQSELQKAMDKMDNIRNSIPVKGVYP